LAAAGNDHFVALLGNLNGGGFANAGITAGDNAYFGVHLNLPSFISPETFKWMSAL
jgi:hypothetical protein